MNYENKLNIKKPQDYLKLLFDENDKFYVCVLGNKPIAYETDINSMEKFQYGLRDRNQPQQKYIKEFKELKSKLDSITNEEERTQIINRMYKLQEILEIPKKTYETKSNLHNKYGSELITLIDTRLSKKDEEFKWFSEDKYNKVITTINNDNYNNLSEESKREIYEYFVLCNEEDRYFKRDNIQYSVSSFEVQDEQEKIKETEEKYKQLSSMEENSLTGIQKNELKKLRKFFNKDEVKVDTLKWKNYQRNKKNVKEIKCLFFDFDEPSMVERQEKKLFEMLGEPTAVVESSPGKRQIVYKLEQGVPTEKSLDFEKLMYLFNVKVEGDPAVRTTQQILRLPFYENVKGKYKREDGTFPKSQLLGTSTNKLNFDTLWNKYKVEAEKDYEVYLKNKKIRVSAEYPQDFNIINKYKKIEKYGLYLSIYKQRLLGKSDNKFKKMETLFPDRKIDDLSKEEFQVLVKSMGGSYRKTDWNYSKSRAYKTDNFLLVWNEIKSFRTNLGNSFEMTDNINSEPTIKNQFDLCFTEFVNSRLNNGFNIEKTVKDIYPKDYQEIVEVLTQKWKERKEKELKEKNNTIEETEPQKSVEVFKNKLISEVSKIQNQYNVEPTFEDNSLSQNR